MIFSVKIKYNEETAHFAVEADSYTIAEAMAHRAAKIIASEYYEIDSITKTQIKEVLLDSQKDEIRYFKSKVSYMSVNDSGKVKKTKVTILISDRNISGAFNSSLDFASGFMDSAEVIGIEETDMTDFFDEGLLRDLELTEQVKEMADQMIDDVF